MGALVELYRRLDRLQRRLGFRVAASVAAVLVAALLFGPLIARSHDLERQRAVLRRELAGQNLTAGDPHALSLRSSGEVIAGGRTYGGRHILRQAPFLFDAETGDLVAPDRLIEDLLADQRPSWAPDFLLEEPLTTWLAATAFAAWLVLIVWMEITIAFLLTLLGTAGAVGIALWAGSQAVALAFAGMGLLTFTFVLLTRALLIAYRFPNQVLAVAHTVIKEATRSRLSLVFVILLLIGLPLLPVWLDPDTPLRFRIQTFISRSLGLTYSMAACMTLFLSCASVAFEIRDRQIWQLMTKPLGRFNYLAGKWLGVLSVNAIILAVAGVSIFVYVKHLSRLPVAAGLEGVLDRLAVRDEILTARLGARPQLEELSAEEVRARVLQTIERDPELAGRDVPLTVKRKLARETIEGYANNQRSVPPIDPLRPGGNQRTYVFKGLDRAKNLQSTLTLRYRFHILRDDEHATFPVGFVFDEDPSTATQRLYIPTVTHTLPVGADLIRDDGTLSVTVFNLHVPQEGQHGYGELNFEEDNFELLYKVGNFEGNFLRAMVITWVKLGFLSMLGIACATALSFPVACLLSFTIFLAGTVGPFLAMSLEEYYPPEASTLDWSNLGEVIAWLFQSFIRATAQGVVFALHTFSQYRPTHSLVGGRLIDWSNVGGAVLWLGAVWSGVAAFFGWLVIRNRQLAIYSGHG